MSENLPDQEPWGTRREPGAAGHQAMDRRWPIALSLIEARLETGEGDRQRAVVKRLAELSAEGGAARVEEAVLGLTSISSMFIEMYADLEGSSVDSVLEIAASLGCDNELSG
jgi:hypothetical protein